MANWTTDRTSILTYQSCPRKFYYHKVFGGKGIQRKSKSLALCFGAAFHEGVGWLLGGRLSPSDAEHVDTAVAIALQFIDQAFAERGVDLGDGETASLYALNEQKAIAEGLIRGWWSYEGERFLDDFEVLEVEKEGRAELGDGITLLFRPDAVVRERLTGDIYVVSWKTESSHGKWSMDRAQTDMQSMSEVWGVEQTQGLKVEGVLYRFAVKGSRRMDDYLGFKVQDTPLAYGWMRKGSDGEMEWAWRYKWASDEPGRTWEQLPKGFRKVSVWDNYPGGVKAWVEALGRQEVRPFHLNALEGVFPQSLPVSRRADEIDSWKDQVQAQERRVKENAEYIHALERIPAYAGEGIKFQLDRLFPQHTHSCFSYNSRCPFYECCFTPAVTADPMGSGLYMPRIANHPMEKEEEE